MRTKATCPVCRVSFFLQQESAEGETIICPVCGAKLTVTAKGTEIIEVVKTSQQPEDEINQRISEYARLRDFDFDEDKGVVLEGLLEKQAKYGDFYCPCRIDNVPENICPCAETRSGSVQKNGHCY
ncbi:MAG TPA: ferredoxin-thioredoxin reductase catalytic domain-containing protein [Bacillota bacterium]|nr:ferredoxin-thioredoxin reductase catalytic domain-containing protein [Bacillota bacterium]